MTENVPAWFVEKYTDRVKHLYQQSRRRLGGTVSGGGTFIGDKAYFPRMGAVEMYDSPAFAQLALANANMDFIEVTCAPKFIAFGIWDPHKNKLSINLANEYAASAVKATYRAEDRFIADALRAGAEAGGDFQSIGDYAAPATMDDIAEAIAILGSNEAFEGEEITVALPWRNKVNFALDPLMHKSNLKDLPWDDVNWRSYEGLQGNGDSSGVDIYVYAKSALVSGYNDEATPINERIGGALTTMIGQWVQAGAKLREGKGCVRVKSQRSFSLFREPVPTFEMNPAMET